MEEIKIAVRIVRGLHGPSLTTVIAEDRQDDLVNTYQVTAADPLPPIHQLVGSAVAGLVQFCDLVSRSVPEVDAPADVL